MIFIKSTQNQRHTESENVYCESCSFNLFQAHDSLQQYKKFSQKWIVPLRHSSERQEQKDIIFILKNKAITVLLIVVLNNLLLVKFKIK